MHQCIAEAAIVCRDRGGGVVKLPLEPSLLQVYRRRKRKAGS